MFKKITICELCDNNDYQKVGEINIADNPNPIVPRMAERIVVGDAVYRAYDVVYAPEKETIVVFVKKSKIAMVQEVA